MKTPMRILVINGANLGLVGKREPAIYGTVSLKEIQRRLKKKFPRVRFTFVQTNSEGTIVDHLNKAFDGGVDGGVINPGAYAHYSYAIRDAIAALSIPVVEAHISTVPAGGEWRRG